MTTPKDHTATQGASDIRRLVDAAMAVIGQHDAWVRQMPAGEFDDPLYDAINILHEATQRVGIAQDIAAEGASESSEREPFEAWCRQGKISVSTFDHLSQAYPPGTYCDSRTWSAWLAWQARAALAQRQPAPADPQAPSQEAVTIEHLPGTSGDSLEDAMKWAASQEAREYPPLPEPRAWQYWHRVDSLKKATISKRMDSTLKGAEEYAEFPLYTAEQVYACIDSDRKARQQEALDARRYRWIRSRGGAFIELQAAEAEAGSYGWRLSQIPEAIDAAIDAALAKGPSHE